MAARGDILIEGIDVIIKRDLDKHKSLLEKNNMDIQAFETARTGEIGRKRYYNNQKGKRNYDDDAMDKAIEQMAINIAHLSDRIKITKELRKQNTQIVDTLTPQLAQYYKDLANSKN
jgi:hypothetical protein